jgi:GNAT superfamily N-acetyltransferase
MDSSTAALNASPVGLRSSGGVGSHSWPEHQAGFLERLIGPEFVYLGLLNGYRYRYKHAILNDHVCTPGEAYVEFVCTLEGRQGAGTGTRLMRWAQESAERLGCGRIRLTVMGKSAHLKARYERLGYSDCRSWTDPVALFFMRYVFGIKDDEFFEMEKPLGLHSGLAIYSKPYGFASERLSGSGSFDENEDDGLGLSLHDAAVSLLSSTRGALSHARELVSSGGSAAVGGFTAPGFPRDMNCSRLPLTMDCFDSTRHVSVDLDCSSSHPMIPVKEERALPDSSPSVHSSTTSPLHADRSSISEAGRAIAGNLVNRSSSDSLRLSDDGSNTNSKRLLSGSRSRGSLDGLVATANEDGEAKEEPVAVTGGELKTMSGKVDAARDIKSDFAARSNSTPLSLSTELEEKLVRVSYLSQGSVEPVSLLNSSNSEDYGNTHHQDGILV